MQNWEGKARLVPTGAGVARSGPSADPRGEALGCSSGFCGEEFLRLGWDSTEAPWGPGPNLASSLLRVLGRCLHPLSALLSRSVKWGQGC